MCLQKWEKDDWQSFETMDALVELAASFLEAGYFFEADTMSTKIRQKAEDDFGWNDERTIWAKMSIGLVYQAYRSWDSAKPWFDAALAASSAVWGKDDGITRSLQKAMEKRRFPFILDKGRPFKPILGFQSS